jgi:hypothetical protein
MTESPTDTGRPSILSARSATRTEKYYLHGKIENNPHPLRWRPYRHEELKANRALQNCLQAIHQLPSRHNKVLGRR